jgi:hypothetical protein
MDDLTLIKKVVSRFAGDKDLFREQGTGRYMHSKWSRICKLCGHPVGVHAGEKSGGMRPCFHGDHYPDMCDCPVFTSSNEFMTDEAYDKYMDGKFDSTEQRELRAKGKKSDAELESMSRALEEKRAPKKRR